MIEIIQMLQSLSEQIAVIHSYLTSDNYNGKIKIKEVWIDGQDVMLMLHISKRTLQSLRNSGTLPYSRIRGKFYYKVEDIEKLLESNYSNAQRSGLWK